MEIITNIDLGFKLTNSMSFVESVFSAGFIQKTVKVDLYIRINRAYSQRDGHQKDLEDTRGHHAKAERRRLPGGAARPNL